MQNMISVKFEGQHVLMSWNCLCEHVEPGTTLEYGRYTLPNGKTIYAVLDNGSLYFRNSDSSKVWEVFSNLLPE